MPENPVTAPSQPAPPAQSSDAAKSNGPENVGVSQYARQFLNKPVPAETPAPVVPEPTTTEPTAPVVAAESPAEVPPEAPSETESDDALSQSTSLAPEVQETINKRIAKITAKRKDAERRAEAAEAALVRMAQTVPQPQQPLNTPVQAEIPTQPLAKIQTIQELQKLHQEATEAVWFAEQHLDRDDVIEQPGSNGQMVKGVVVDGQFYSKEQLRTIKYNAQRTKETEIPQRAQFLSAQNQAFQKAVEVYPWMKDQGTVEYQTAIEAQRENPWIRNLPNAALILGRMVEGIKAERALAKGTAPAKPAAPRPRPSSDQAAVSSADTGITRAPAGTQARNAIAAEEAKLATKGNVTASEFAASLTRKRQLRNTL